jgi:hypothetical protein
MIRSILCTALLLMLIQSTVWACSCNYAGPFLKVTEKTGFVALVKVSKYLTFKDLPGVGTKIPMSMEVEIIDIYKGRESRKTIAVWGDIGNLCRPYLSAFKENEYYVIAFQPGGLRGHPDEKQTDYTISSCGANWLNVDYTKMTATGDIDSKDRTQKTERLKRIRAELAKQNS